MSGRRGSQKTHEYEHHVGPNFEMMAIIIRVSTHTKADNPTLRHNVSTVSALPPRRHASSPQPPHTNDIQAARSL